MREKEKLQMRKTVALIYRFIFILFSVWGICQYIGFNILSISANIMNFTFFVDLLCFICITAVFIVSVRRSPGFALQTFKNILTFCAIIVLLKNHSMMTEGISYSWILRILLPIMMVIDWILFDNKGKINFYDPLLWLLGALLIMGLLSFLLQTVFGIDNFLETMGLFKNKNELLDLLGKALGLGFLIYLVDCITDVFGKKSFSQTFALIYRLLFLALEVYAFVNHIGKNLPDILSVMQYYYVLTNFLCAVCIAVLVVYNLIKFKSLKRTQNPFPTLKGAFTVAIICAMLLNMFLGRSFLAYSFSQNILHYIAPIMMFFDWILFDTKGRFEAHEPLIWLSIPVCYYIYALIYPQVVSIYPGVNNMYSPKLILWGLFTVLAVGYGIFVIDKIAGKRK